MGLKDFFNRFSPSNIKNSVSLNSDEFLKMLGLDSSISSNKLSEVTYFTCLRLLSESLSKLPLKMYQEIERGTIKAPNHNLNHLLKRPNPYMTPSTFWSTVELNRNHHGNSFVYIAGTAKPESLWILPSDQVQIWIDNAGWFKQKNAIWYIYTDTNTGKMYKFRHDEILHFKTSVSLDGISGLAVKDILKVNIENGQRTSSYLNNYYKNGLMGKAIVYYTGDLSKGNAKKMAAKIEDFASGTDNAGKVIPLPVGFELKPLNISMTDSQFLEISKYTALQIAGAFGIKPSMINNYDKGNYANVETQQRDFYVNTLLHILKSYEEEITFKLLSNQDIRDGYKLKFNANAILRADFKTQIDGIVKGVVSGVYTPNEGREMVDLPPIEGGDEAIVNGTFIKLKNVGQQYGVKGGDNNNEVDEDQE
ncbi:phage portal protein, HK97 family [Evansella cellulosilytica DSM 2522]|uniref:Phage portal protein, HK97 family n=1 Tax=Evansella cellulosilytica (strain ATCC 21833 / DSM 2522 / FERM P-1141 / JCM 9156 / N-4) TaxID=649639 RepID=E6U1J4_EVAC2|nr:phage portal protein, HK97 family [Evansella cellulosilytica DSM 2522]